MSNNDIRLTQPTLKVLHMMLLNASREGHSGAAIAKATKIGSGTLYPLLDRLETAGWLTSKWEKIDPHEAGRPRRRFYQLTALGQRNARAALADLQIVPGGLVWTA